MLSVFPARLRGRGVFIFLVAFALAGCSEARTAAQPSAGPSGPNAYLSARALDAVVFQPGTATDIRPTGKIVEVQLRAETAPWKLAPGKTTEAVTYNGQVPGPTIRATEGDTLRVTLTNRLQQDTSIHWHGLHIKNDMDGVSPFTQAPIGPGATFVYEFTVSHAGTFMYHPHTNAVAQIDNGLYGVLIVDPQQPDAPKAAHEFTMMLGAWNLPSSGAAAPQGPSQMPGGSGMPGMGGMGGMMPRPGGTPGMGGGGMMMNYNWFTYHARRRKGPDGVRRGTDPITGGVGRQGERLPRLRQTKPARGRAPLQWPGRCPAQPNETLIEQTR
ncbi:MAG: hypothetical protein EXR51_08805 [Dehalococcoidia bacterium]|nr:hypothetical protein [Dehalococcoidia bacterium]